MSSFVDFCSELKKEHNCRWIFRSGMLGVARLRDYGVGLAINRYWVRLYLLRCWVWPSESRWRIFPL